MASISVAVLLIFGFVASDQIFIVTIPMFKDNRTGLPYIKVDVCDKPMSALIGFRSLSNSLSMLSSNGIIETVRKDMGYIHYANDPARVSTGIHSSNETFIETDDIPKGFDGSLARIIHEGRTLGYFGPSFVCFAIHLVGIILLLVTVCCIS